MKSLNGNEIKPKKMVLHEQDSKVILLNNELDKKVFYMDLEKGKVIDELVLSLVLKSVFNNTISMLTGKIRL